MNLEFPEQCLMCLDTIVQSPKSESENGHSSCLVSCSDGVRDFDQLCEYLKIEFPISSQKFKNVSKILKTDSKDGLESMLCSSCVEMVNALSVMYSDLRRIQKRIDYGIRVIQDVVRRSEEGDMEAEAGSANGQVASGGGGSNHGNQALKRRRMTERSSAAASSSVVADYFEFVDTFRNLVKEVVTQEPKPVVLSAEADALAKNYQKLEDESDEKRMEEEDASLEVSISVLPPQNDDEEDSSVDAGGEAVYFIHGLPTDEGQDENSEDASVYSILSNVDVSMETPEDSEENSIDFVVEDAQGSGGSLNRGDPLATPPPTTSSLSAISLKSERKSYTYTCRYCQGTFNNAFAYYSHRKQEHPDESKALNIPTKVHVSNSHNSRPGSTLSRVCPLCGDGNISSKNSFLKFMEHMLSHEVIINPVTTVPGDISSPDEDKPYSCDICEQRFLLEMNLDLHKICYHESTLIQMKCEVCGDTSSNSWEDLFSHLVEVHKSQTIYTCKSCPMAFVTADKMLEHMQVHVMSKRLPCPECSSVAPTLKNLYQHFHEAHPNLLSPLQCTICQEVFVMPSTYRRHLSTGHSRIPATLASSVPTTESDPPSVPSGCTQNVRCPHCLDVRMFKNASTLENHIKIHHDVTVEKHSCQTCGKSFVHRSTLKYHIQQVHLGIRYGCPHCPKSFTAKSLLKGHLKLHNGEGPAVINCSVCGRVFSSLTALKTHKITQHMPSTPVNCDICGKSFLNTFSLRAHKSEVHNLKPYACPHCPLRFSRLKHFQKHLNGHDNAATTTGEVGKGGMPLKIVAVESVNHLVSI